MAKIILNVPEKTCESCHYRRRNNEAITESYHCAIFDSRADGERPKICKDFGKNA